MRHLLAGLALVLVAAAAHAEDGYDLWLRYSAIEGANLSAYRATATHIVAPARGSATLSAAQDELVRGLSGLLNLKEPVRDGVTADGAVVFGTPKSSALIAKLKLDLKALGPEGYLLRNTSIDGHSATVIAANTDVGVLYGTFAFLRLLQTRANIAHLDVASAPRLQYRLLNHWDNLDGTIERGYAGWSIWDWHKLPDYLDARYTDYARADASIGINGTVLNNVGANALSLSHDYLVKAAALASVFRTYGIHVFLSAKWSAPIEIGGLKTADPLDPAVKKWWKAKADEIYKLIPDFGGFLVKANSEGQPGPQDYGRTHADGANILADALAPHGGIVMWRAFVYSDKNPEDRAKQAYNEFVPLDGKFKPNVIVQVKNGAIDFQPREPFHPLFGATPKTPLFLEVQLTKEYLGQATHLVYLAPLYKETLDADTYAKGPGSTVGKVIDGSLFHYAKTGMAGVSNIGNDRDWTGGQFDQANWYAFGRLAWDYSLTSQEIADEWARQTFSNDPAFVKPVVDMMMLSREAVVDYMTPIGLHHQMDTGHHYGPGPWVADLKRPEWNPMYYSRADASGIGFDRTSKGSNAVSQYAPPVAAQFNDIKTTPEQYLLWFHHVAWDYKMPSGRTLWQELVYRYSHGVDEVQSMQATWAAMKPYVDDERFQQVSAFLRIQDKEARWWRDASLAYFQTFAKQPIKDPLGKPLHPLAYYESLKFPYAPGHPPYKN